MKRGIVFFIFFAALFVFGGKTAAFASSTDLLSGYAWSDNIGWISFNDTNHIGLGPVQYGVTVSSTGAISGYAWTDSIGWISFNRADVLACPAVNRVCAPTYNVNRTATGFARALAYGDGWEGWIEQSGIAQDGSPFGVTSTASSGICQWQGWSWGGDVVGWISWSGPGYGVLASGFACAPPPPQCSDTIDNDGDGLIDYPADPGCINASDNDETNPLPPQCWDTIDNDGDGKIDFPQDPGCINASDNDERDALPLPPPQCSDTIDNDGDGLIDYPADPGCVGASDNSERDTKIKEVIP